MTRRRRGESIEQMRNNSSLLLPGGLACQRVTRQPMAGSRLALLLRPSIAESNVLASRGLYLQMVLAWSVFGVGFGVGQQCGCPLVLRPARTYAGQHAHWVDTPRGHRGNTAAGAGQIHPRSRGQRVWMVCAARAPLGPPVTPPLRARRHLLRHRRQIPASSSLTATPTAWR